MDQPQTCAKCMAPIGNDAVFLKNGTYLCPACYQRAYPAGEGKKAPKRFDVSVEGIIAIIAVTGVCFLGYKVYNHFVDSKAEERRIALEREQREEQQRADELAAADARSRKAEIERKAADERLKAEREAKEKGIKLSMAARDQQIELGKIERERKYLEEQKRVTEREAKEKAERDALAAKEAAAIAAETNKAKRERMIEISKIGQTIVEAQKVIAAAEAGKPELQRKSAGFKSVMNIANETRQSMLRQYQQEFNVTPAGLKRDDISKWRNPPPPKKAVTQGQAVVDHRDEYAKLVQRYDAAVRDYDSSEKGLAAVTDELKKLDATIAEARGRIDDSNRTLMDMKATPEELARSGVTLPPGGPKIAPPAVGPIATETPPEKPVESNTFTIKPGMKAIVLKNGKIVPAQSVMSLEDEVRYKDEDGKWQTLKKADVDKIQ